MIILRPGGECNMALPRGVEDVWLAGESDGSIGVKGAW
jgi:hypothetical protein